MQILLLLSAAAPAMVPPGTLCNVTEVVISLAEDILLRSVEAAHIASHILRIPPAALLKDRVAQTSLVQECARMLIRVRLWAHLYVHLALLAAFKTMLLLLCHKPMIVLARKGKRVNGVSKSTYK